MSKSTTATEFSRMLGIEYEQLDQDHALASLHIRPELCNTLGILHGGVTSTIADVVMGRAAAPFVDGVQQCVTIEMKVNFIYPVEGSRLIAEATVIKRGKKIIFTEAKLKNDKGNIVATASGTYARVGS